MGSERRNDLVIVAVFAYVAVVLALLDVSVPIVRAVAGLPFVLGGTGYAVLAAIFPWPTLRRTERILGSVALSMAFATLGAFVLNWTSWGLRPQTWAVLLGTITLAGLIIARRRRRLPVAFVAANPTPIHITATQSALFGFAAVVIIAAIGVAYLGAVRAPSPGFTQLWLLPADGDQVRAGIRDFEREPMTYNLRVRVNGATTNEWTNITLNPDETWEKQFPVPVPTGDTRHIEALLFRAKDNGAVYRRATIEG